MSQQAVRRTEDEVVPEIITQETHATSSAGPSRPHRGEYFGTVLERAMARRAFLKGASATGAALVVAPAAFLPETAKASYDVEWWDRQASQLRFATVPPGNNTDIVVPPGYDYNVIIRWGDALFPGVPDLDVNAQHPQTQALQFGYNADLVLWFPLPLWVRWGVTSWGSLPGALDGVLGWLLPYYLGAASPRSLVWVNHEYTQGVDMFPGYDSANPTDIQVFTEIEAHGGSVIEIAQDGGGAWRFVKDSPFNRRITGSTPIEITGPLRGSDLLKTAADPTGTLVFGTLNNCAGGKTPWGTVLTAEENFDQYFAFFDPAVDPRSARIPAPRGASDRKWERFDERFNLSLNPNEYHRHGYVVEIDPYDPHFVPKKRTALGRFKHEAAVPSFTKDGRVAIYSGDDARFEYVFKFVTAGTYQAFDRAANLQLLDEGTLYVARFDAGEVEGDELGSGEWLPLVWEPGNALDLAGFTNQEEVLLDPRGAADVLGATPMDRPEDVDVSPKDGHVFIVLTNNTARSEAQEDESNPRGPNPHGHIIELIEDGDDAAATTFHWNVFVNCGDPAVPEHETKFGDVADPLAAGVSPIASPDNIVFDDSGNLWISTDGQFFSGGVGFGQNDGVFAVPVTGTERGLLRQFLSSVPGAEVCGPEFSGDNRTFFCALQHPHDGQAFAPLDSDGNPIPLWPVGETVVSRPSLLAVRELSGRKIGR